MLGALPNSSSGSNQLRSAPLGFEYTGYYDIEVGFRDNMYSDSHYWSRTADSADGARHLYFNLYTVGPQSSAGRGYGFAVRCGVRRIVS